MKIVQASCIPTRFLIQRESKIDKIFFKLLNIYGPCLNYKPFWEMFRNLELLSDQNMIIGGDLNLILSNRERYGLVSQLDQLAPFFSFLFDEAKLLDVDPRSLRPTWSNNRMGEAGVAKILDKFLVPEHLLQSFTRYRSWVRSKGLELGISDHWPMYLELGLCSRKIVAPYKFNHVWLKESVFRELI